MSVTIFGKNFGKLFWKIKKNPKKTFIIIDYNLQTYDELTVNLLNHFFGTAFGFFCSISQLSIVNAEVITPGIENDKLYNNINNTSMVQFLF